MIVFTSILIFVLNIKKEKQGLIEGAILSKIVDQMHINSGGNSLMATGAAASNLDLYQVNCTYFDALGRDENAYLIARAIQFFVPGIPQVYYVGLFAGENYMELLGKTNVGRDINRHYYSKEEIRDNFKNRKIVSDIRDLMKLRNTNPAFGLDGSCITEVNGNEIIITRECGQYKATLKANLKTHDFTIEV